MSYTFLTTAFLDLDAVEAIIKQAVQQQTGREVESVKITTETHFIGYGLGESQQVVVKGAEVRFVPECVDLKFLKEKSC